MRQVIGIVAQAPIHPVKNAALVKCSVHVSLASWHSGQNFDALVDTFHRPDMELSIAYGLHHCFFQHQIIDVAGRDQYTLISTQTSGLADGKKSLDFFVDAADGLHFAFLIDRSGNGDSLIDR